jgi:hypothetical protein
LDQVKKLALLLRDSSAGLGEGCHRFHINSGLTLKLVAFRKYYAPGFVKSICRPDVKSAMPSMPLEERLSYRRFLRIDAHRPD